MMEDIRAVRLYMLVQAQARSGTREQARERGFAHRKRVSPHVVTVKFDQVEGVEEHACVVLPVPDAVKGCDAVLAASNRLPINETIGQNSKTHKCSVK